MKLLAWVFFGFAAIELNFWHSFATACLGVATYGVAELVEIVREAFGLNA